ncbi:aerolysin [Nitzschia inconspicua]|uniref:Aerolysin n=1 Tax=Nitzschia inconspicua TaxID=303405 RepID=A0A9K3PI65_9STRA|nr:aerolysin [Nitzschia inconspicua]
MVCFFVILSTIKIKTEVEDRAIPRKRRLIMRPFVGVRSSLKILTVTAALQHFVASSGTLAAATTKDYQSIADQFWRSVDQEPYHRSLEWMLESDEVFTKKENVKPTAGLESSHIFDPSPSRFLRNVKKEHVNDFHWPSTNEEKHRLIIRCKPEQNQEDCVSELFLKTNPDRIKIVHNLNTIHAISIEVDSEILDFLLAEKYDLHRDFVRTPMVVTEEVRENADETRNLQEGQRESWGFEAIRAKQVWDVFGVRGRGVKVCVLDTGLDASHEDFQELRMDGYQVDEASEVWSEDRRGHGTHITGIIAASDNNLGTVGIAPDVDIFVVKVFDETRTFYGFAEGTAYSTDLIAAAQVCKEAGADIISASLGGQFYDRFEDEYFRKLYEDDGILTVAASGNGGNEQNFYPAGYQSVFSVSAADKSRLLAWFSTLNPSTSDILAPGVDILSTYVGDTYRSFSGTSMAAPHATGVVALMLSYIRTFHPDVSYRDIFPILRATARKESDTTLSRGRDFSHVGVIDAYAAVEALANGMQDGLLLALENDDPTHCQSEVRLEISTDDKGFETAYRLKNLSDGSTIWMTPPDSLDSNSRYSETTCLDATDACFRFDIRDMGGDGIQGTGIKLYYRGHALYSGGSFGGGGMLTFGDSC